MSDERRNDVGMKTTVGGLMSVCLMFIGLFVNAAWITANEGKNIAVSVQKDTEYMKARFDNMQSDMSEIKMLLKRAIPNNNGIH